LFVAAEIHSRLFNSSSPPDLLRFIVQTVQPDCVSDRVLAKARAKVYTLLASYLDSEGGSVAEYGPLVRDACVEAVQRETDAKAAVACLAPLLQLVQSPYYTAESLRIGDVFALLMKMLRVGKLGPSMKGLAHCMTPNHVGSWEVMVVLL
jgi:hypothetical protein